MSVHIEPLISFIAAPGILGSMKATTIVTRGGFRSTFSDWVAERTDCPAEVREMALAHAIGDATEAAYRRGDLFNKRRKLMTDWATFLNTPAAIGGNVVKFKSA